MDYLKCDTQSVISQDDIELCKIIGFIKHSKIEEDPFVLTSLLALLGGRFISQPTFYLKADNNNLLLAVGNNHIWASVSANQISSRTLEVAPHLTLRFCDIDIVHKYYYENYNIYEDLKDYLMINYDVTDIEIYSEDCVEVKFDDLYVDNFVHYRVQHDSDWNRVFKHLSKFTEDFQEQFDLIKALTMIKFTLYQYHRHGVFDITLLPNIQEINIYSNESLFKIKLTDDGIIADNLLNKEINTFSLFPHQEPEYLLEYNTAKALWGNEL